MRTRHAAAELHRLVDLLDCPLVTTAAGKGVLAESHPANFGTSLPYPPIQRLIADADAVLAVGTELGETDMYFTTKLPLGGVLVRIDVDAVAVVVSVPPKAKEMAVPESPRMLPLLKFVKSVVRAPPRTVT